MTGLENMTPSEKEQLKEYMEGIAAIFYNNTPSEQLENFEVIELALREHILTEIGPALADFFYQKQQKHRREE